VAPAICPTHACHFRCHAIFLLKKFLEGAPFKVNLIQLKLLQTIKGFYQMIKTRAGSVVFFKRL
jgi:hypothetical protein